MSTPDETLTPRQFAEQLGYKPHYGNQLAKDGRLVFAPDGKRVLVQASIERFNATKDPSKQGVADRHALTRAGQSSPLGPTTSPQTRMVTPLRNGEISPLDRERSPSDAQEYDYQSSKAKREHWAAEREHAAFRKDAGELIELAQHIAAMTDVGATVRSKLEAWASTLPPQLAGRDEAAVRATLTDQIELLLSDVADRLKHHAKSHQEAQHENSL